MECNYWYEIIGILLLIMTLDSDDEDEVDIIPLHSKWLMKKDPENVSKKKPHFESADFRERSTNNVVI